MNQGLPQELNMSYCNMTQQQCQLSTRATRLLPAQLASPSQVWAGVPPSPLGIHTGLSQGCRPHRGILAPQTQPSWESKQKDEARKNPLLLHWQVFFLPLDLSSYKNRVVLPTIPAHSSSWWSHSHIMEYQQCASLCKGILLDLILSLLLRLTGVGVCICVS